MNVWYLVILIQSGPHAGETLPWLVYTDAEFSHVSCQSDQEKYTKTLIGEYLLICERFGKA